MFYLYNDQDLQATPLKVEDTKSPNNKVNIIVQ